MKVIVLFLSLLAQPALAISANQQLGKVVDECHTKDPKKHLWIFKQWHLSPTVNTFGGHGDLPQYENQKAIFKQLATWINENKFNTIYSEGCSGEITDHFSKTFNGWNFDSLARAASSKDYDDIMTLIPLKIKAKYGSRVHVYCGDDEGVIKKQGEALSDARGNAGFLARIEQYKNKPEKSKPYLDKIIELDHLPAETSAEGAIKKIKADLTSEIAQVKGGVDERNKSFVAAVMKGPSDSALVVGGIHAHGIMELLKKAEIDCTVIEPAGYRVDDEKLLLNFLEPDHK